MKKIICEQGSPEWHRARAGVITASKFKLCRERLASGANKGDFKKDAHDYAFRLAVERISGVPLDDDQWEYRPWQGERGITIEEKARQVHEVRKGILVEKVGFVVSDDGWFGASADGQSDLTEGCEYKAFLNPGKLRDILLEGDLSDVVDQMQGGMWVTGWTRWRFGLYCPALTAIGRDFVEHLVERDDAYIAKLAADLQAFKGLVMLYESKLRKSGAAAQPAAELAAA